jgi:hypothetical protein
MATGRDQATPDERMEKEIPMKTQALAVVVALTISVVAAGECFARPSVLHANIPFAFAVGDKWLPAGQYQIETVTTGSGTLQVIRRSSGGGGSTFFSTIALEAHDGNSKTELVFHRYGNEYFLSQIWNGEGKARQLIESNEEKEAAHTGSAIEVALSVR